MNNGVNESIIEIDLGKFCNLLEESSANGSVNLGSVIIHDITHPLHGRLLLVNTADGRSALFSQSLMKIIDSGSSSLVR